MDSWSAEAGAHLLGKAGGLVYWLVDWLWQQAGDSADLRALLLEMDKARYELRIEPWFCANGGRLKELLVIAGVDRHWQETLSGSDLEVATLEVFGPLTNNKLQARERIREVRNAQEAFA